MTFSAQPQKPRCLFWLDQRLVQDGERKEDEPQGGTRAGPTNQSPVPEEQEVLGKPGESGPLVDGCRNTLSDPNLFTDKRNSQRKLAKLTAANQVN